MSARRLTKGGLIDRARPITFRFQGRTLQGYAGDTLASALLAGGVRVLGRSFKYHRPRGLLAAGVDEPNALIQLGVGAATEANLRATEIELQDGLVANPVNCWPSARFDLGAVNRLIERFIPAGFYYKTFMWPDWRLFEGFIRRAAGLGRAAAGPDPDRYETSFAHCDVLVVGAGPAGIAAALAASAAGARVILAEQDSKIGGSLLWQLAEIDGMSGAAWIAHALEKLQSAAETRVLTRTTVAGYFDHNSLTLVERVAAGMAGARPRQRLWTVRAARVVLATGALERPLVFPGNDRPGVMLANAVRQYLVRWAVLPGERAVVFTNNDTAYAAAHALLDAGARVVLLDSRIEPPAPLAAALRARDVQVLAGTMVIATHGHPALNAVSIRVGRKRLRVPADLLAVSGGWNPTVHLFSQSGGQLAWDSQRACFQPGASVQAETSVGAAAGAFDLALALRQGWQAGGGGVDGPVAEAMPPWSIEPLWVVDAKGKAFVDFQNDVSTGDIALAARENLISVEHLKRYTTLGMAPDQGKTSNVNALAVMAALTGRTIEQAGTTRLRFPFTPIALGALGGNARGALFRPIRRLPTHDRQMEAGAVFEDHGGWLRPACYQRAGETRHEAEQREALAVRRTAGLFEASPFGKIEVVGPDAAEFLDRVYANTMSTLKTGALRYGLMLNEHGIIIDDGIVARMAPERFLVGTTSAGAARIAAWLEEWRQCEWPSLRLLSVPVTAAWATLILAGPRARDVLKAAQVDFAITDEAFPHMTWREGHVAGIPARLFRASFTGEVSYEIYVPANRAEHLWDRLTDADAACDLMPVGIDAWMLLRAEKGFLVVGIDTDGQTTPADVGWGHVLRRPHDFIGRRSLTRAENLRRDRLEFVGLEALEPVTPLPVGAHLRGTGMAPGSEARGSEARGSEGYVTSTGFSPALGRGIALGMIRRGRSRQGEILEIVSGEEVGRKVRLTVPGAYDREGVLRHG